VSGRLAGKRCLVTGGGSGIGRAVALRFAAEGAVVVVAGRRAEPLQATAASAPGISTQPGDAGDVRDARKMVDAVVSRHGGLDVLFHAAGTLRRNEVLTETTQEEWDRDLNANLTSAFQLCRAAIPYLVDSSGTIVLVASQLAHVGSPGYATYCATKGGIVGLTRALAVDLGPRGVRVNALSPGVVETEMAYIGRDFAALRDQVAASLPLRRVGTPEDMTGPAVFLASGESGWMTGHSLVVDGGWTAQ
jgi:meso-butanediol dehydrogenase/(S,S)-butanediol dehydrogenase/diacetyl reductase